MRHDFNTIQAKRRKLGLAGSRANELSKTLVLAKAAKVVL
jgi:hypothetical protein